MSRILRAFKAENKFTRHLGQISVEKFYEFKIGTAKRTLERLGIQTSSSFIKI